MGRQTKGAEREVGDVRGWGGRRRVRRGKCRRCKRMGRQTKGAERKVGDVRGWGGRRRVWRGK